MQYRERRELTEFDGVLETEYGKHTVQVQDVTPKGLRLRGLNVLLRKPEATLVIKNHRLRGFIRWGKGEDVGFELDQPLSPHLRAIILRRMRSPAGKRARLAW